MSENSEQAPYLVVGAGIGGLTAALSLARHGLPVQVHELRTSRTVELAGTGMTIWSNATTALGDLGLGDAITGAGEVIERVTQRTGEGREVFDTDVAGMEWPGSRPSVSIARGALMRTLLEACDEQGVALHFGNGCTGWTADADGVDLHLADGGTVRGRALVGADGVRSSVRAKLVGDGDPYYYGVSVYRGLSNGSGGIERGLVHMFQTRDPSGLAGMAWHVGEGRVAWTIGQKAPVGQKDAPGTMKKRVLDLIRDVQGPARDYVEETDDERVVRVDLFARDAVHWGTGRVTLLGDAGHGMPTVFGQGACQAIEDGYVLGECAAAHSGTEAALRAYERQRDERVQWIRGEVHKMARMQQWSNPFLIRLREVAGRHIAPRVQPRLWNNLLRPPVERYRTQAAAASGKR